MYVGMLLDARMQGREGRLSLTLPHSLSYCLLTMCVNRGRMGYSNLHLLSKMPKNSSQSETRCSSVWRNREPSLARRRTQ